MHCGDPIIFRDDLFSCPELRVFPVFRNGFARLIDNNRIRHTAGRAFTLAPSIFIDPGLNSCKCLNRVTAAALQEVLHLGWGDCAVMLSIVAVIGAVGGIQCDLHMPGGIFSAKSFAYWSICAMVIVAS